MRAACGNYDFNYDRTKNLRPKRNIRTAMNNEIMLYGIAQKEQLGFDVSFCPLNPCSPSLASAALLAHIPSLCDAQKAVEECKYRMSRYGVTPNVTSIY